MFANEDSIIEMLAGSGMISLDALQTARSKSGSVIRHLIDNQAITSDAIGRFLAEQNGMEFVDLAGVHIDPTILGVLPNEAAVKFRAIPIGFNEDRLLVAISDPLNFEALDSLPHVLHHQLDFVCASDDQIQKALQDYYGAKTAEEELIDGGMKVKDVGDEKDSADAPIIKLVTQILSEAYKNRASDIHIEPSETHMRLRYRIDGALHVVAEHPKKLLPPVISRLKIMTGSMSIAEKRVPQDGRIQVKLGQKALDLRVSTVVSNHGESVVMRILDKSSLMLGLPQLGFFSDDQETFEHLIGLPDGIVLVTGPTGSGKTTTLYACLNYINKPDRKIITVEDPVEYELSGINQVQVKEDIGMTFAAALRSMLRQAPNIVMLGEIRDLETATIAINASLTGHLVFSTLHTNDAPSAVARLADIGIKPFLIASSVRGIQAQRLVRTICKKCKTAAEITDKQLRALRVDPSRLAEATIMKGAGCEACKGTGHKGRLGIYEIFKIDDEIRHMIVEGLTTVQLRRRARELGMRTLREDGVRKVLAGITTPLEVIQATMADSD